MLRFEDYIINSAEILENNPLPDIKNNTYIHADYELTDNVTEEERTHIGKGMLNTILPYKMQDNYTRDLKPRTFKAAILENEFLKAVFLPELGGRLWSLYDKKQDLELLYVNKVFQPGNLALRNAWFSGGVEWNVGIKGHNPLTCETLFAESIDGKILRMYEYERIRDIVYSLEATLEGDKLFTKVTIENTSDKDTYMYWWSNIAVPEEDGTRVIAPADETFRCFYNSDHYVLDKCANPIAQGTDISYPKNLGISQDFFYKIPNESEKWIASPDKNGKGLAQFSSDILFGRKTFLWGMGKGGKRWNNWLSHGDERYIEIQAGLMHTQLEHFVMPKKSTISWYECYTGISCDSQKVHSADWNTAKEEVYNAIESKFHMKDIDTYCKNLFAGEKAVSEIIGSGWGYVENLARKAQGKATISTLEFGKDSADEQQEMWISLIEKGIFPCPDINDAPVSYMVSPFWYKLLKECAEKEENKHWNAYYHLGVMAYANMDTQKAAEYFEKSAELTPNVWALRCLCYINKNEYKDMEKADEYLTRAIATGTEHRALYLNFAETLCALGQYDRCLEMIANLKPEYQAIGRIQLYKSICYMNTGELAKARAILNKDFMMPDIKEGELAVSDIWFKLYTLVLKEEYPTASDEEIKAMLNEKYPLPDELDFRMH